MDVNTFHFRIPGIIFSTPGEIIIYSYAPKWKVPYITPGELEQLRKEAIE
jgi:hypothetical protein